MITQADLQPESIIRNVFTLQRKSTLTQDSYGSLLLKLAVFVFICLIARMLLAGMDFNLIVLLLALVCCLLVGFVLMAVLEPLSNVHGTKNLLLFGLVMAVLLCLILIV